MKLKSTIVSLVIILAGFSVQAQFFRVGLVGGFNSTWLFNKYISDAGDEIDYKASFGGKFGADALYNFSDNAGVSLGIIFTGVNQTYNLNNGDAHAEINLKYVDLPLLFRLTGESGTFFEVGPSFSILTSAKSDFLGNSEDIKSDTKGNIINGVLGFGADIEASDQITITIGLRLAYGLSEVFKEKFYDKTTNAAFGGLHLGVCYKISD